MEWPPNDASSLIRALVYLIPSGGLAWLMRRLPSRAGRWIAKRWNMERENARLTMKINSLEWELDQITRQVQESRARAERIDSLLGSDEPLPVTDTSEPPR